MLAILRGKQFCVSNSLTNVFSKEGETQIYTPDLISVLEEADNRIVCHIQDILQKGYSNISIRTANCDGVVILLGFLGQFKKVQKDITLNV